jgi:EAL and modified HD-GYP domain-containing signal transduction protein
MKRTFLTRYPVVDRKNRLFGYELQVRDLDSDDPDPANPERISTEALVEAAQNPAFARIPGGMTVFIRVAPDFITQDFAELLPREHVVLTLPPHPPRTADFLERLRKWHMANYRVALDVVGHEEDYTFLFDRVDYLKVNGHRLKPGSEDLDAVLKLAKSAKRKLVADHVKDWAELEQFRKAGFHYFQGEFYTQPNEEAGDQPLTQNQAMLIRLFNQLSVRAEFEDIEATFKKAPDLMAQLLNFINSPLFYIPNKISSVRQALVMLGLKNLERWVALLLYSTSTDKKDKSGASFRNPLLEEAIIRGRVMELTARELSRSDDFAESAFVTGALSVIRALLGRPMEDLVAELNLDDDIGAALTRQEGTLGRLLATVEHLREHRSLSAQPVTEREGVAADKIYAHEEQATLEVEDLDQPSAAGY